MTRVCHFFTVSEKLGRHTWGGAERHLRILLPALVAAGVQVEAVVIIWNAGDSVTEGLEELEAKGVKVTRVLRPRALFGQNKVARGCLALLRALPHLARRRRVIVHLHLDMVFMPALAMLLRCKKVAISLHNNEPHWAHWAWRGWLRIVDRRVNQYVAISDCVKEFYCRAVGVQPEKVNVVRYGITRPLRSQLRREDLGLAPSDFVVGFVGRVTRQKNLATFVEALGRVPGVRGVIVGGGELVDELQKLARESKITNISFVPAVENAAGLMPLFDVLCLPSIWEGLGLVLIEAMYQGVPIIGSRAGAIPEVLRDGQYGLLFDPASVDDLAAKLRFAQENYPVLEETARRARSFAEVEFTVETMAQRTAQLYKRMQDSERLEDPSRN